MATKTALKLADYVVTEAGFGADLGAEKFFDIKCRKAKLNPSAAVIVATVRALKMNGGVAFTEVDQANVEAVKKGCANLARHIRNVKSFGVPVVVGINRFNTDTEAELATVIEVAAAYGVEAVVCTHWSEGGKGAEQLARKVVTLAESGVSQFAPLYDDSLPLWQKVRTIATQLYGADDIIADKKVRAEFTRFEEEGFGHLPVCIAKTQYSFSTDPQLRGAPNGHMVGIRELRLAAGAEFVVVVCGDIMTMPGLPRQPAANQIGINQQGQIEGLF